MLNFSLGSLLKSLPRKQVAAFLLEAAAGLLEGLDSNDVGIDDDAKRALRIAAAALRDIKADSAKLETVSKAVANIPVLKALPVLSPTAAEPQKEGKQDTQQDS